MKQRTKQKFFINSIFSFPSIDPMLFQMKTDKIFNLRRENSESYVKVAVISCKQTFAESLRPSRRHGRGVFGN